MEKSGLYCFCLSSSNDFNRSMKLVVREQYGAAARADTLDAVGGLGKGPTGAPCSLSAKSAATSSVSALAAAAATKTTTTGPRKEETLGEGAMVSRDRDLLVWTAAGETAK